MSLARKEKYYTVEEYFALQQSKGERYDYWDGTLVELEATTKAHNRIKRNIIQQLPPTLLDQDGCELYDENVMTQLKSQKQYVYPDIVITCHPEDNDPLIVKFPCIIIEILSDGTEQYDRTEKFFKYQRITSVEQCVFVSQKMMAVESFRRAEEGQWFFQALEAPVDELTIPKLNIRISLNQIYQSIEFD